MQPELPWSCFSAVWTTAPARVHSNQLRELWSTSVEPKPSCRPWFHSVQRGSSCLRSPHRSEIVSLTLEMQRDTKPFSSVSDKCGSQELQRLSANKAEAAACRRIYCFHSRLHWRVCYLLPWPRAQHREPHCPCGRGTSRLGADSDSCPKHNCLGISGFSHLLLRCWATGTAEGTFFPFIRRRYSAQPM